MLAELNTVFINDGAYMVNIEKKRRIDEATLNVRSEEVEPVASRSN